MSEYGTCPRCLQPVKLYVEWQLVRPHRAKRLIGRDAIAMVDCSGERERALEDRVDPAVHGERAYEIARQWRYTLGTTLPDPVAYALALMQARHG